MKLVSLILCFVASAFAQVPPPQRPLDYPNNNVIPIISYVNENNYDGTYKYSYETGNGILVQEEGFLKNPGVEGEEAQTARGTYSYTAPDGQVITVNWYADETGFHAQGAHIPSTGSPVVGPPVVGPPVVRPPVVPVTAVPVPGRPKPPEQNEPFNGLPVRPEAEFFRG